MMHFFTFFSEKWWFWEWIALSRKVALSGVGVFLSTAEPYIQGLSAVFVLNIALILQIAVKPYEVGHVDAQAKFSWSECLDDLNVLEALGLGVGNLTLFLGLWTFAANTSPSSQLLVTFLIVGLNSLWALFVMGKLFAGFRSTLPVILEKIQGKLSVIFRFCAKNRNNKEGKVNAKDDHEISKNESVLYLESLCIYCILIYLHYILYIL